MLVSHNFLLSITHTHTHAQETASVLLFPQTSMLPHPQAFAAVLSARDLIPYHPPCLGKSYTFFRLNFIHLFQRKAPKSHPHPASGHARTCTNTGSCTHTDTRTFLTSIHAFNSAGAPPVLQALCQDCTVMLVESFVSPIDYDCFTDGTTTGTVPGTK